MTYDLQTFRDLFGSEAGMLLFTYARGDDRKEGLGGPRTRPEHVAPSLPRRTLFGG